MGNCSGMSSSQESIVYLLEKEESAKAITMFIEFPEIYKTAYPVNSFGDTALHYAAALGNIDVVRWLCTNGADINAVNSHGWTSADSAAFCEQKVALNFLLSAGAQQKYFIKPVQ